jgi:hypothetical protein
MVIVSQKSLFDPSSYFGHFQSVDTLKLSCHRQVQQPLSRCWRWQRPLSLNRVQRPSTKGIIFIIAKVLGRKPMK